MEVLNTFQTSFILKMISISDRAKGCMYGQAIGDALGTRYEFDDFSTTNAQVIKDKGDKLILPILGGGPFSLKPGQVTDDTELAMALGRSLVRQNHFDPIDVAVSYVSWYHSPPFDIGHTTRSALAIGYHIFDKRSSPEVKKQIFDAVCRNAKSYNAHSLSNGCLMRISPLAIASVDWSEEELLKAAELDTKLTNPDPIAIDAVKVYTAAIRTAILTGDRQEAYRKAVSLATTPEVKRHLETAKTAMIPVITPTGKSTNGDQTYIGYLGVALQFAFYQLLNAETFASGLEEVIRAGGDTDTNGCITGALLGAIFGAETIPQEWKSKVVQLKCKRQERYEWVNLADLEEFTEQLMKVKPTLVVERPEL